MLIIVDGPDCVGKTTLVNALRDALERRRSPTQLDAKVDVVHRGPPTLHPLDEYEVPLLTYRPRDETHVICDRWHLGELVYPEVFGRASQMTDPVFRHIELLLASRGAFVVLMDAPVERIQNCVDRRGDDLVTRDQVGEIRERFLDVATRTTLPLIHMSSDDALGDAIYDVIGEAEQRASACAPLGDFVTYVGPRWPERLLLGDVRLSFDPEDPRPAFMPYNATSGYYLLDALGDDARFVGIVNACDVDDAQRLVNLVGNVPIVALGANAARTADVWMSTPPMSHHRRAYHRVPHPQYVRRFHHSRAADYRSAIVGEQLWRTYA